MVTYELLSFCKDQTKAIRNFIRRCALRTVKETISGTIFCQTKSGLYQWLNTGKLSYIRRSEFYVWRNHHTQIWEMGDAEATVWYALLAEEAEGDDLVDAAIMASKHAAKLLGKWEIETQERSLKACLFSPENGQEEE